MKSTLTSSPLLLVELLTLLAERLLTDSLLIAVKLLAVDIGVPDEPPPPPHAVRVRFRARASGAPAINLFILGPGVDRELKVVLEWVPTNPKVNWIQDF